MAEYLFKHETKVKMVVFLNGRKLIVVSSRGLC